MRVDLNRDFHEKIDYISFFHQCKIIPGRISAQLNETGVNAPQNQNLFLPFMMSQLFCNMCQNTILDKNGDKYIRATFFFFFIIMVQISSQRLRPSAETQTSHLGRREIFRS